MNKFISIKFKIISVVLLGFLVLGTIGAIESLRKTRSALLQAQFDRLLSVETSKHSEINKYLYSLKELLLSLSTQLGTKYAFLDLENSFHNLENDLELDIGSIKSILKDDIESNYLNNVNYDMPKSSQIRNIDEYIPLSKNALIAQYIFTTKKNTWSEDINDSNYIEAHNLYHESFNNIASLYGLKDAIIADLKGNLVYTSSKGYDFATNVHDGVYSHSSLAEVYKKALNFKKSKIAFSDFAPYEPSHNSMISFMATPIFIDDVKKGVLIIKIPIDKINSIATYNGNYNKSGLGKSGEVYLVNEDYMMITNSRFYNEIDHSIVQFTGSTIGILEVNTSTTRSLINNKNNKQEGSGIISDYRGLEVLSVYHVIDLFSQGKWIILSEIDKKEALQPVVALRNEILTIFITTLLAVLLIVFYLVNKVIVSPLLAFQNGLLYFFEYLNKKTTTLKYLKGTSNDEIGSMTKIVNQSISTSVELHNEIEKDQKEIKEALDKISVINKEIESSIQVASLIQHSILPAPEIFNKYFSEYAMIWEPRDTVGGDIYFAETISEDEILIFFIDCTGHGVPGAFLTLLLKSVSDKAIHRYKEDKKSISYILRSMYVDMKKLLNNQKNFDFDGSVIYYNKKEKYIQLASQNGYMFTDKQGQIDFIKVPRLKRADIKNKYLFPTVRIDVNKTDIIHITTDGFIDQWGGPDKLPFGKTRFIEMINKHKDKPTKDFEKLFMQDFEEYRNNSHRLDDVMVLSVKI